MALVVATLELLSHTLKRKPKALFPPDMFGLRPCQMRLWGSGLPSRLILLCLDELAFPPSRHSAIIALAGDDSPAALPSFVDPCSKKRTRKKTLLSARKCAYNFHDILNCRRVYVMGATP